MRVRTSRTILLWLGVIIVGGMLLLALAGDAGAKRELPAQVATWGFIGLLGVLMCRTPRRPDRDMRWALETMGTTFLARVPPVVESLFGSPR